MGNIVPADAAQFDFFSVYIYLVCRRAVSAAVCDFSYADFICVFLLRFSVDQQLYTQCIQIWMFRVPKQRLADCKRCFCGVVG